ncbi:hypothetical protein DEM27_22260 [Metarhizobium album]|uniref:Uncharacterized protein n=1 Tax=Metarhizobium album TaxID=2182425 RepID=A0A2U2DL63_9HYPH|nr:hypothetical protein [Rhizobium album]PWE54042.1 hypothetical protein DEM27_22260 [Rhizobium album]
MLLEFYRAGQTAPSNFDMFLHADGSTSYSRNPQKTKLVVRVVVELEGKTTTILQQRAMFGLINKNKTCTVAFYEVLLTGAELGYFRAALNCQRVASRHIEFWPIL